MHFFQRPLGEINILFAPKDAPNLPSSHSQKAADPGQGLLLLPSPFVLVFLSVWSCTAPWK